VQAFEKELATYVNATHAVSCSSGTAALHLICLALGLKPGDQVIVPTVSFVATANAARYCGTDVIFADVDPASGNVTPETISSAIDRAHRDKLKAIFVVHIGGTPVDLKKIASLATNLKVPLVEDACHAIGTNYPCKNGQEGLIGDCSLSAMTAFSFHPTKTMTTGEGGAVTTSNPEFAKKLSLLRNHGLVREPADWKDPTLGFDEQSDQANPWVYELQNLGFNYRMSDLNAALGRSQLSKLPKFASQRKMLAERYNARFSEMPECAQLTTGSENKSVVRHLMIGLFNFDALGLSRKEMMARLREFGIGTQVHYIPIHLQPYYSATAQDHTYPGATAYYHKCLSLPFHAGMSEQDVDRVCDAIEKIITASG